uniref:Uncharacterized protein n=1 Tax=Leptobrachium leishanense TaxID=445787 RepID=A0A8C5LY88_9ANUR
MGSLESKNRGANTERISKDAVAEQQENGHVKANGDAPAKENGDPAPSNGSAESAPEDVISPEAAPSANGDPKPEDPSGKATKKKRFSFKKQFKLPFRSKTKKEAAESPSAKEEESSPPEAQAEPVVVEAEATEKPTPEAEVPPSDATDAQPEPATPEETPKPAESAPTTEPTTEPQKE